MRVRRIKPNAKVIVFDDGFRIELDDAHYGKDQISVAIDGETRMLIVRNGAKDAANVILDESGKVKEVAASKRVRVTHVSNGTSLMFNLDGHYFGSIMVMLRSGCMQYGSIGVSVSIIDPSLGCAPAQLAAFELEL